MNNQADNHQTNNRQADNWLDKENDMNKKKLRLFRAEFTCPNRRTVC